ncbi:MAG: hypothetical protein AAFX65_01995 [Cyanobacteria bacterium J06638_7]
MLRSGLRRAWETRQISFAIAGLQQRGILFRQAATRLRRSGIILIRGAADANAVAALAARVGSLWSELKAAAAGTGQTNAILNQEQQRSVRGYKALVQSKQPVVNFRYREDEGMIDVFHPERLIAEHKEMILHCLQEDLVSALATHAFEVDLEVKCRNLYLSEGIDKTRPFHCDGEKPKVKAFLYLSDVSSLGYGPYCYVLSSHRDDQLRRSNQIFNTSNGLRKDDYRLLSGQSALPVFCKAGDLVVSAQHGAHRGLPQAAAKRRAVLVSMFNARRDGDGRP